MSAAFKGTALYVWSRHRPLLGAAVAIYLAIFVSFDTLWGLEGQPLVVTMLTFLRAAPFFLPLLLFATAASVFSVDLASRESAFPRHFFTLPVGSVQLALPFLVYGALLWAAGWAFAIGITDGRVLLAGPLQLPPEALRSETWFPFLELSLVVWGQALIWTPFRHRGARVVLVAALVAAHFGGLVAGIRQTSTASDLSALALVSAIAAAGAGVWAVVRARRGDPSVAAAASTRALRASPSSAPSPSSALPSPSSASPSPSPAAGEFAASTAGRVASHPALAAGRDAKPPRLRRLAFRSALDAHVWYEWRLHGLSRWFFLSSVIAVLILTPMLLAPRREVLGAGAMTATGIGLLFMALVFVPSFGPLFASFAANRYNAFTMPSFFAALPLSSGDFAWAKMRAAARSVALMCAAIGALVALGAALIDGSWPGALAAALRARYGAVEGTVLFAAAAGMLPLVAIAATMNTVWFALADRRAIWRAFNAVLIAIVFGWLASVQWMQRHPDWPLRAAEALPAILIALAAAKLIALGALTHRVATRRLYPSRRIGVIGGAWLAAVLAGFAVCIRYVPGTDAHALTAVAAFVVLVPVLGVMGAPLALQLNRVR